MQARKQPEPAAAPIQLSLRIRHPSIDPGEISASLGLEPEYSFKAGDLRKAAAPGRTAGRHPQTYWLAPVTPESWTDPIEPSFLAAIAERNPVSNRALSAEALREVTKSIRYRSLEGLLLYFLNRLNARRSFLQRIQADGGDVSVIMVMERESAADFTLPVSLARLLVDLGISIEFKFDS
jgi:hypothetical protein